MNFLPTLRDYIQHETDFQQLQGGVNALAGSVFVFIIDGCTGSKPLHCNTARINQNTAYPCKLNVC